MAGTVVRMPVASAVLRGSVASSAPRGKPHEGP
jgi:hypothetical protein